MTAAPIPFDPAPVLARLRLMLVLVATRTVATIRSRSRTTMSDLLLLAGTAAATRGLFLLAAWLGWVALGLGLLAAGWLLAPRTEPAGP